MPNTPFLDNWPVYRQLWNTAAKLPGDELDLSNAIDRNVTAVLKTSKGAIAATYVEGDGVLSINHAARGVVRLQISDWTGLNADESYQIEVSAYGGLYDIFSLASVVPNTSIVNLDGVEVYASPREILELIGRIPNADVQTLILLTGGWAKDVRGYWTQAFANENEIHGIWIDDKHAREVPYSELATAGDRAWARVRESGSYTVYYKGKEDLSHAYVETAFSIYVWRSLQEATAEIERRTGRFFSRRRVFRELQDGTYQQNQVYLRQYPAVVDEFFRLDLYGRNRTVWRRFDEASVADNRVYVESETGTITISEDFWGWDGYGIGDLGVTGRYYPSGVTRPGQANVEVTFTAGPESIPVDVAEACANLAAIRQMIFWSQANTQGLSSMNIGCVSMNFAQAYDKWIPAWQSGADRIIDAYRSYSIIGM